ncbi:MAG: hypothetical protein ACOYN0_04370 [Phycisphaerales bacterium]
MKHWQLGHPLIAAACLAWLGFDAWRLGDVGGSTAGNLLRRPRAAYNSRSHGVVLLIPHGSGYSLSGTDGMSHDEMSSALAKNSGALVVEYRTTVSNRCLWAPVFVTEQHELLVSPIAPTQTARQAAARQDLPQIRDVYARWLDSTGSLDSAAGARQAPRVVRRTLWVGLVRNTAAAGLAVLLGLSLLHTSAWMDEQRRRKRLWQWAQGTCPACGYRVEDLAKCPECGRARGESPTEGK